MSSDTTINDEQKFARDYHLAEMNLRRDRQWRVLTWSVSVLIALLSGILLSFRFFNLGFVESLILVALILLVAVPAFQQIKHDGGVAHVHWKAVHGIHQSVPMLKDFSDEAAGLPRRVRPVIFMAVFAAFIILVTLLLGIGALTVK